MTIIEKYSQHFLPAYSNYPQGRYITLLLIRQVESEAIFRTEGSGEPLSKEFVHAGASDGAVIQRVVISKRKQTAVERRTGRELLRANNLLFAKDEKSGICSLNRNNPCEQCMDCMIYGYAAGGGGAQKSRVITDDAFSLHPAHIVTGVKQFNAPFESGSPWDRETNQRMTGINTDEYVKPETLFLDMETFKDLTADEFRYVMGNVLRSGHYGAISSRIGKVHNHVAGVILSDCEVFSNLELTQLIYDRVRNGAPEPDFPLPVSSITLSANTVAQELAQRIAGQLTVLPSGEVTTLVDEITALYQDETAVKTMLENATRTYRPQA